MPKKFAGENSKAVQAKARKAEARNVEVDKKAKAAEDALWAEDDKLVLRKQEKKEAELKKAQEKLARKLENDKLLEEENKKLKSGKPPRVEKVTRYEIDKNKEQLAKETQKAQKKDDLPELVENVNRIQLEDNSARNVEEAISVLNDESEQDDKHPEKRRKAAFAEFSDLNLERLKTENPSLKLSQLKQILFKDWQKSPMNPMNK